MKSKHTRRISGFSLIELMTVVSIMAILTTVAVPSMKTAMINAQMARATANARSIVIGLRAFATDNDGMFPYFDEDSEEEFADSNEAFRTLVPYYIDSEAIFTLGRSAWGKEADNRFEEPEDRLEPGENHYAYVAGLTDTSRTGWPLVVDGTDGKGTYTSEPGKKGGCWEGRKAIMACVGGSASAIRLRGDEEEKYLPREGYPDENALDVEYMGEDVKLLDPAE